MTDALAKLTLPARRSDCVSGRNVLLVDRFERDQDVGSASLGRTVIEGVEHALTARRLEHPGPQSKRRVQLVGKRVTKILIGA